MLRKYLRRVLPSHQTVRENRYVARFGHRLQHHNLWHLHRRSVAGGVAAGLFAGLIPGSNPVQFTAGALLAVAFKVNLPLAVLVTLYSNPFTIVPLYWLAFKLGQLVLLQSGGDLPTFGVGLFAAGVILAIMILPTIVSISREVISSIPGQQREAMYALGATQWEMVTRAILPAARSGIVGALILGLGRALGETMAVTFVIGNAHHVSASLFAPGTTISASIANEFTEAVGDLYTSSLIALGLILFFITFVVLGLSKWLLSHMQKQEGAKS